MEKCRMVECRQTSQSHTEAVEMHEHHTSLMIVCMDCREFATSICADAVCPLGVSMRDVTSAAGTGAWAGVWRCAGYN
jgi:hypothetical protein